MLTVRTRQLCRRGLLRDETTVQSATMSSLTKRQRDWHRHSHDLNQSSSDARIVATYRRTHALDSAHRSRSQIAIRMRRQTDKQLRQYPSVGAAMTRLEAAVAGLRLQQVLVMACVLSVVSATTFHQHVPAGICTLISATLLYKTVILLLRVSPLFDISMSVTWSS